MPPMSPFRSLCRVKSSIRKSEKTCGAAGLTPTLVKSAARHDSLGTQLLQMLADFSQIPLTNYFLPNTSTQPLSQPSILSLAATGTNTLPLCESAATE